MNLLDRFCMLYINNYGNNSLEFETPEYLKTLQQQEVDRESTATSNFCEGYSNFIKEYKANRTTTFFNYTEGSYRNQAWSEIRVTYLDQ